MSATRKLAATAASAAAVRGPAADAPELAMTVAVCSAMTVVVRLSVMRVTTPRLLTAPVAEDEGAAFVVPVMRNMLDPSSWLAVMMERVDVGCAFELPLPAGAELDAPVDSDGADDVRDDAVADGSTTTVVSCISTEDERVLVPADADADAVPLVTPAEPEDDGTATSVPDAERDRVPDGTAEAEPEGVLDGAAGTDREDVPELPGRTPESVALALAEGTGRRPESLAEVGTGGRPELLAEAVGTTPESPAEAVGTPAEGVADVDRVPS